MMRSGHPLRPGCDAPSSHYEHGYGYMANLRLCVDTMDAVIVDYETDGRVRFENEEWTTPTLQERRAILHAAQLEIERLGNLVLALDPEDTLESKTCR